VHIVPRGGIQVKEEGLSRETCDVEPTMRPGGQK